MDRAFVALRPFFGFIGGVVFTLAFLGATQLTAVVDNMIAFADNVGRLVAAVIGVLGVIGTAWASATALKNSSPAEIIKKVAQIASAQGSAITPAKIAILDAAGEMAGTKQVITTDRNLAAAVPSANVVAG